MKTDLPKPMCFIAMPFGKKSPPGKKKPLIDFDLVCRHVELAVADSGFECIRADFESAGGFIHRPMYERLLVAEYVIADLTLANPNVAYEVGVRHGSRAKATLLICAAEFVDQLPFDLRPLRVYPYALDKEGNLEGAEAEKFRQRLRRLLKKAASGELPADNPILQVTSADACGNIQHEKTDVFLNRIRYAGELGEKIADAISLPETPRAVQALEAIENRVFGNTQVVAQLHSTLTALYLGYREKKAYSHMVSLYKKLPGELQQTPVAVEQLALALNRLAEERDRESDLIRARQFRQDANRCLERLEKDKWTSETYGIAGRIYKGLAQAEETAGNPETADAALKRAIETYEKGFRLDPRDYYPGINAVTLRLKRATQADLLELSRLVPVVRFSVDRAPSPGNETEKYWQQATKLELACAQKDWDEAKDLLSDLLAIGSEDWMRETTVKNLEIQKQAYADDPASVQALDHVTDSLQP